MAYGTCYICEETSHAVELHHILPQATGGKDGPTVPLCPTCHRLSHQQALNILAKTPTQHFFHEHLEERAMKVVRFIVVSIQKERENPDFGNPYPLQIPTTKGVVALLHILKTDAGYTNLQTYIEDLLKAQIRAKFGRLGSLDKPKRPSNRAPSTPT